MDEALALVPRGFGMTRALPPEHPLQRREPTGQSALPRFNPYAIPQAPDPKAVDCPYCVKRPRNLQAHCRAVHPDKPEAR